MGTGWLSTNQRRPRGDEASKRPASAWRVSIGGFDPNQYRTRAHAHSLSVWLCAVNRRRVVMNILQYSRFRSRCVSLAFTLSLAIAGVLLGGNPAGAVVYCQYVNYPQAALRGPVSCLDRGRLRASRSGLVRRRIWAGPSTVSDGGEPTPR